MRALIVTAPGAAALTEISPPEIRNPDEALVRIRACGICSTTDRELIAGTQPYHRQYPCVLGHEAIGEVVAVGAAVRRFAVGDLVTRPVAIWPGSERDGCTSAWGGFAEWGVVCDRPDSDGYLHQRQRRVPAGTTIPQAVLAISLAETASVVQAIAMKYGVLTGQRVVIAGTGVAGISLALWCRLAGAASVVVLGRRRQRLDLAEHLSGARGIQEDALESEAARCDLYIDAVGDAGLCTRIRAALPSTAHTAIYSVLPGHTEAFRPEAAEHLCYDDVCARMHSGDIEVGQWLGEPWPLARWKEAFSAVASGSVFKAWIRCDDLVLPEEI